MQSASQAQGNAQIADALFVLLWVFILKKS